MSILQNSVNVSKNSSKKDKKCKCGNIILYYLNGPADEVLEMSVVEKPTEPKDDEVIIKIICSPVNHMDIEMVEGEYPFDSQLRPKVAGNEGVGVVTRVGCDVKDLKKGDWVIPYVEGMGWWRKTMVVKPEDVYKVPTDVDIIGASMLCICYSLAYRILKDVVELNSGDVIIQNAANSTVGQVIIQLCKKWGIKTINTLRYRYQFEEEEKYLLDLGASYVLLDIELDDTCVVQCDNLTPKLGINAVGNGLVLDLLGLLDKNTTCVTYAELSGEPLEADIDALVYKNITVLGYWLIEWKKTNAKSDAHRKMLDELVGLMKSGELKTPKFEIIPFKQYCDAIDCIKNGEKTGKKYILDIGDVSDYIDMCKDREETRASKSKEGGEGSKRDSRVTIIEEELTGDQKDGDKQ